mgnify:CR=1 FL=1
MGPNTTIHSQITSFPDFDIIAAGDQWIGKRENQEDSISLISIDDSSNAGGLLAILADGMGGMGDGAKASKLIVSQYAQHFQTNGDQVAALKKTNQALKEAKEAGGMLDTAGATLISVHITAGNYHCQSVGDSLLYHQRGTKIRKLNTAHTWEWELKRRVKAGEMTQEEADADTGPRHALYAAVCGDGSYKPGEKSQVFSDPIVGDRIIISSDGFQPLVDTGWERLLNAPDVRMEAPDVAVNNLMNKLKMLGRPRQDNSSIIIIDILPKENPPAKGLRHSAVQQELLGDRDNQQDSHWFVSSRKATLAVVADGAGGHAGGAQASATAVECMKKIWLEHLAGGTPPKQAAKILSEAIIEAHGEIIANAGGKAALSGKCAIVVAYLCGKHYTVLNVGDCRAYVTRHGKWNKLTTDDSLLQLLIDKGEVDPKEARNHPDQSVLTQALGGSGGIKPHCVSGTYSEKDSFLLCCDGLWNQLPPECWNLPKWKALTLREYDNKLKRMICAAYGAANGSSDNISAIWVQAAKPHLSTFSASPLPLILSLGLGAAAILALGISGWYLLKDDQPQVPAAPTTPPKPATSTPTPEPEPAPTETDSPMTADALLELIKEGEGKLKALRDCKPESQEQAAAAANWEEISNKIYNFYTKLNTKKKLDAFLAELKELAKEEDSSETPLGSSAGEAKKYSTEDKKRFTRAVKCFLKFKDLKDLSRPAAQGEGIKPNPGEERKKACKELCEGFETSNDQATPRSKNTEATNNLLKSAAKGDLGGVKEALDNGAVINGTGDNGYTALHWAASKGHSDCVKYLLDEGADCNKQDSAGNTALHVAAMNGCTESVKHLVDTKKADLTITNNAQQTALALAQLEKAGLEKAGKATENYDEIIDMLTRALGESPEPGESPEHGETPEHGGSPEPGGKDESAPSPPIKPNSEQDQGKP